MNVNSPSTSAADTVDTRRVIFKRNGLPDTIVSDNATRFTAYEFTDFFVNNEICHLVSPRHGGGGGERAAGGTSSEGC